MLLQAIFSQGTLEMSQIPLPPVEYTAQWADMLSNRILTVVMIAAAMLDLPDFISTLPNILDGISSRRGSARIEHSMSIARSRNITALICAGIFLLMADRYGLFQPRIFASIPSGWTIAGVTAALLAYLLLRRLTLFFVKKRRLGGEDRQAAHRVIYSVFIVMVCFQLVTVGLLSILGCQDAAIRMVLLAETGIFFLLDLVLCSQILAAHFSGLATILYLCALEILPAGAILAAGVLL